jgi:allantoinase
MSKTEFSVKSERVLLPGEKEPVPATVLVRDGKFESVVRGLSSSSAIDFGRQVIMPGLVDTHAHINEPGRTEWEGFRTATRAAAAGGITTVIDMPLNSIPATTSVAALETKARSAQGACRIDYGFWGGVIPGNAGELTPMVRAGALGFKAFMIESGVEEFPWSDEKTLREAMTILAKEGAPLLAHAECARAGAGAGSEPAPEPEPGQDPRAYSTYLHSRPPEWELNAIRMLIRLAAETGCKTHVVHLSAAGALRELHEARAKGVHITAETCPHYLSFSAEEIPEGATQFKCAPPIRERANREELWRGVREGLIDFVVSDHSPCTPALKELGIGSFEKAWGGIAGLQFSLPVTWTGMKARGMSLCDLPRLMCEGPARFAGLAGHKGSIFPGRDADFIVWNPEARFIPKEASVLHRHSLTPYLGKDYFGVIQATFVRGQRVFDQGAFPGSEAGLWQKASRSH